jgi:hypothetical protein
MDDYQFKFLEFLINEIFENMELHSLATSFTKYWIHTIKNDEKRNFLINKTKKLIEDKMNA